MISTLRFLGRKLFDAVIILLVVSFGATALAGLIPGSPAALVLGEGATPEAVAELNAKYGFDDPIIVQYWHWLVNAIQGNLGFSLQQQVPVTDILASRVPVTVEIAVLALVASLALAIPLAMLAAQREGTWVDRAITGIAGVGQAIPSFVGCVLLAVIFIYGLRWFPTFGWVPIEKDLGQNLYHLVVPIAILVIGTTPMLLRVLRADVVQTLREDFILAARSRGLTTRYIMVRHALRPSSLSLFTLSGLVFGHFVGGTIILETFFALPGLGQAVGNAVLSKDLPLMQGAVVMMALVYLVLNAVVDAGLRIIDPQTRGN